MEFSNNKTKQNERKNIVSLNSDLEYHFPSLNDLNQVENTLKETNVSKNLKLGSNIYADPPKKLKTPIGRIFNNNVIPNPINNILNEYKKKINQQQLNLPYIKPDATIEKNVRDKPRKRTKQPKYQTNKENNCSTPVSNRQIVPSPGDITQKRSNKLTSSTPVAALGPILENKLNIPEPKQKKILDKKNGKKTTKEDKDTEYDNLACHADNIMRMAVDSTMLGSTFNGTFSFSFSNTFNDSILMSSKKKGDYDIIDEDEEDKSVLEILRSRKKKGLNKSKAFKIDINAEDLQAAVNDENLL